MNTIEKLNALAEFQAQRDLIEQHKKEAIELAFPDEIRKALADIDAEFADKAAAVDANIENLKAEIKDDVLAAGETVKGDFYQAVWSKGRTTWDSKQLEKLLERYPTLSAAKKTGDPSVSFKTVA